MEARREQVYVDTNRAREVFSLFDVHEEGVVSTDELGTMLRGGMGKSVTEEQLEDIINDIDIDESGRSPDELDFAQFHFALKENALPDAPPLEYVEHLFKAFDMHKTGHIQAVDLVKALREYGEPMLQEDVENLMAEISEANVIDGDQRISIRTFVEYLASSSGYDA